MHVRISLCPLVVRRPVPLSAMFTLAPAEAVTAWGGFDTPESVALREYLSKLPNPEMAIPRQGPFGSSRCLVLWGSAGCGASLFGVKLEFDGRVLESLAIMTPVVDLDDSEIPESYETTPERFGWIHMPRIHGKWVLIDPIYSGDEALPEGLKLELQSAVDLCVSLRLCLFGDDLAQLHVLMDSSAESVRRLLGSEYRPEMDRELPLPTLDQGMQRCWRSKAGTVELPPRAMRTSSPRSPFSDWGRVRMSASNGSGWYFDRQSQDWAAGSPDDSPSRIFESPCRRACLCRGCLSGG